MTVSIEVGIHLWVSVLVEFLGSGRDWHLNVDGLATEFSKLVVGVGVVPSSVTCVLLSFHHLNLK